MSPSLTVEVEAHAELPKLVGGLWHPYRRKWATERKHHALVDVAAASGWRDTRTLLTCYQQRDVDAMLAVMREPRKVRDSAMITVMSEPQTTPPVSSSPALEGFQ